MNRKLIIVKVPHWYFPSYYDPIFLLVDSVSGYVVTSGSIRHVETAQALYWYRSDVDCWSCD